jgi:hypothetical protein
LRDQQRTANAPGSRFAVSPQQHLGIEYRDQNLEIAFLCGPRGV